jgi:hypothetical protein
MNGNISRKGITADLEAMARVGMGGVQIFNISLPDLSKSFTPAGPVTFLSPEWFDMLYFAASEAKRLGIEIRMHNCPGWSAFGGPWITPELAAQTLTIGETQVKGGTPFKGELPKGEIKKDFYRDIAVLAFPTPSDPTRTADVKAKALMGNGCNGLKPQPVNVPAGAIISPESILDLTAQTKDGILTWDVPAGDWTILRIGHTCTGIANHPAPAPGTGLNCDMLSRKAMEAHFAGGIQPILDKLGPLAGKVLTGFAADSYEGGIPNWTAKMREEFKARRGYDLLKFLPAVTGRTVGSSEQSERFLWDFRRTIGDLIADNCYGYLTELCHKSGLLVASEPYFGPFETLQVGAKVDIPQAEFWVSGNMPDCSVKQVSSTAHTHGLNLVEAEAFTAENMPGRWLQHPATLKGLGDLNWAEGINRFVLHSYPHQPWGEDVVPGMTMGQYGTHFTRNNTWWEQSKPWFTYLSRGQYLLQAGRHFADILCFAGEESPNIGPTAANLRALGYDYDTLGSDLILKLSVRDGRIFTPAGASYRLLQIPAGDWMRPEVARHLRDLVQAGACIVGPKPSRSPSLLGYPACDEEVRAIANELWGDSKGEHRVGKGRVFAGMSVEEALAAMNLEPDCMVLGDRPMLPFLHRTTDKADIYFVANSDSASHGDVAPPAFSGTLSFRVTGRIPEFWDAETGLIKNAPVWRTVGGRTEVKMDLQPQGSVFVVFRHKSNDTASQVQSIIPPASRLEEHHPKLKVESAFYGTDKLAEGMVEAGAALANQIKDGRIDLKVTSGLVGKDPAPNVPKRLGVIYEVNGVRHSVAVPDHRYLSLPAEGEAGALRIIRAVYGVIPDDLAQLPPAVMVDVTGQIAGMTSKEGLQVEVGNNLSNGVDLAPRVLKHLELRYTLNGVIKTKTLPDGAVLKLPERTAAFDLPAPGLIATAKGTQLLAWENGDYQVGLSDGSRQSVAVKDLSQPLQVQGPWNLTFQEKRGAPEKITLPELQSLSTHQEPGVRYFSGQVTYQRNLNIPKDMLGEGRELYLDLGQVEVIAEVTLNGHSLGTLWKAPYRVDISGAAKPGENDLSIRVTTLWPNRLIGDDAIPVDGEENGEYFNKWPDWLKEGKPPATRQRVTFVSWHHWRADSNLLASGLMGPVTLRPSVLKPVVSP